MMTQTTLVFDLETDGLIPDLTTIHSLVIKNVDTGQIWSCHDQQSVPPSPNTTIHSKDDPYREIPSIQFGLEELMNADVIAGHNIQDFDIPAIQKLYPWFKPKGIVRDTLIMSRLVYADMKDADFRQEKNLQRKGRKWIAKHMYGNHSLKAWGQRMGFWKGDYGEIKEAEGKALGLKGADLVQHVWGKWSQSMQDYCEVDVEVTHRLWRKLNEKKFSEESIQLEHDVRRIIARQEAYGFAFDEKAAVDLYGVLAQEKADIEAKLITVFKPWYRNLGKNAPKVERRVSRKDLPPVGFKTKRNGEQDPIYVKAHYSPEWIYSDIKLVPFNPGSRFDIADRLIKLFGWEPKEYTNDGHPKVDEEVLQALPWDEAKLLTRYLMIQKRIGQIADGKEAWLKNVRNGRLHGRVQTNGAVTGRMTHSKPNIAQVPSSRAPFGHECRALFIAGKGKVLVGCDADALELRDLAGYMAIYDSGAYISTVIEGNKAEGTDMHTLNAKSLGCDRDTAKTWFYAFIYGSGDENLGNILGFTGAKAKKEGKAARERFLAALPALNSLIAAVQLKANKQGYIKGLDGRLLNIRSAHAALNTLLQSAGAIQMKRALVILDDNLQAQGFVPGVNYEFVANVHDEWQIEVDETIADLVGETAAAAIRQAGEYYKFRCPLAGNYDKGRNWAETH